MAIKKSGLYKNEYGYLRISAGPHRGEYAHRAYVARQLGRLLTPSEEVHHLCGNRACWPPTDFHLCIMDASLHHAGNPGRFKIGHRCRSTKVPLRPKPKTSTLHPDGLEPA
jgi:hypothetical protein